METRDRVRLDMAGGIQAFNRIHPNQDPGLEPVFTLLDERIGRADVLIQQQAEGDKLARAEVARRSKLRKRLQRGLLKVITSVGEAAAQEDPAVGRTLKAPAGRAAIKLFIPTAEAVITAAKARVAAVGKHGLTSALLDEADSMLAEYKAASARSVEGRQARIQAGAELKKVTSQILALVDRIDGLNRHRFADQPEVIAAWESARNQLTRSHSKSEKPATPADGNPTPATGTGTGAAPAA